MNFHITHEVGATLSSFLKFKLHFVVLVENGSKKEIFDCFLILYSVNIIFTVCMYTCTLYSIQEK